MKSRTICAPISGVGFKETNLKVDMNPPSKILNVHIPQTTKTISP